MPPFPGGEYASLEDLCHTHVEDLARCEGTTGISGKESTVFDLGEHLFNVGAWMPRRLHTPLILFEIQWRWRDLTVGSKQVIKDGLDGLITKAPGANGLGQFIVVGDGHFNGLTCSPSKVLYL